MTAAVVPILGLGDGKKNRFVAGVFVADVSVPVDMGDAVVNMHMRVAVRHRHGLCADGFKPTNRQQHRERGDRSDNQDGVFI